jgi:hypothetical protein
MLCNLFVKRFLVGNAFFSFFSFPNSVWECILLVPKLCLGTPSSTLCVEHSPNYPSRDKIIPKLKRWTQKLSKLKRWTPKTSKAEALDSNFQSVSGI